MARTLSSTTQTEIAKAVTKPFWLVYIGFGTPLRYSSGATVSWNSQTWTANDLQVSVNPDKNSGTLRIQNTDYSFGQLVMNNDGIADVPIKIYQLYGDGSYAVDDAELLFDGVGGRDVIGTRWVEVELKVADTEVMFAPRIRCTKEMGFNHLPPNGLVISWGGEQFTLEVSENA